MIDSRDRVPFAPHHLHKSVNIELGQQFSSYLGWSELGVLFDDGNFIGRPWTGGRRVGVLFESTGEVAKI